MRRLVLPGLILLVLLVKPATVLANGWNRAAGEILFGVFVIPLILIGIALVCAIQVSKSKFALLYYPMIGGLIAAACVPPLFRANLSAEGFLRYGVVYGLAGLVIGGLAFLIRAGIAQHSAKDKPPGDSNERP
jgi:hypothetical protein